MTEVFSGTHAIERGSLQPIRSIKATHQTRNSIIGLSYTLDVERVIGCTEILVVHAVRYGAHELIKNPHNDGSITLQFLDNPHSLKQQRALRAKVSNLRHFAINQRNIFGEKSVPRILSIEIDIDNAIRQDQDQNSQGYR